MDENIKSGVELDLSVKGADTIKNLNKELNKSFNTFSDFDHKIKDIEQSIGLLAKAQRLLETETKKSINRANAQNKGAVENFSPLKFKQNERQASAISMIQKVAKQEMEVKRANERIERMFSDPKAVNLSKVISRANAQNNSWGNFKSLTDYTSVNKFNKQNSAISMITAVAKQENKVEQSVKKLSDFETKLFNNFEARIKTLTDKQKGFTLVDNPKYNKDFSAERENRKWEFISDRNVQAYRQEAMQRIMAKLENEKSNSAPLLLTADAGKEREQQEKLRKLTEQKFLTVKTENEKQIQAEKEVTKAKIEEVTAAKKSARSEELTANQKKKYEVQQERIATTGKRIEEDAAKRAFLEKRYEDTANSRAYKEKHPELFGIGGMYHSWKFQGAKAAFSLGNAASQFGAGGRIVGDVLNIGAGILRSPAAGVTGIFTTLGKSLMDLGEAATTAFADIEATKTQLGVVFSNQTQANAMFGDISQYAVKSPFGIQQTSELAILLKQSGVYASDLMNTLKMLGDTAGGNMEKMKRIANNYAQIVSIGKASMLDMRQFAYAGIPIFEAVSKELGVSQQQLRKLISDGKVTSDIIEKVFKDLTGINGIFENATEKGAKTLKARLQNLSDAKQLAMASIGEWGTNLNSYSGNDSTANKLVTTAENIYQWLHDFVNTKNIEKSVQVIENRENKLKQIEDLIKYIENNDNTQLKDLLPGLKEELKRELAKRDLDKDRAAYLASYNMKAKGWLEATSNGETRSLDELKKELDKVNADVALYNSLRDRGTFANGKAYINGYEVKGDKILTSKEELRIYSEAAAIQQGQLQQLIDYAQKFTELTEEDLRANRENNLLSAQALAYDKENKEARATDSLNSYFQKLYELEESSERAKKKKEEEEKAALKLAQNELKTLSKKTDSKGILDFTKLSKADYEKYAARGAFNNVRKLTVTEGKSEAQLGDDRKVLTTNINHALSEIGKDLNKSTPAALEVNNRISSEFERISNIIDNDQFYKEFADFNAYFDTQIKELGKKYPKLKSMLQKDTNYFYNAMNVKEVRKGGEDVNIDEAYNKGKVPIALWKRILGNNTGLSPAVMTSSAEALDAYHNNMAVRGMASGMLNAAFKNMSLSAVRNMVRTDGSTATLAGDNGKTYQIDWEATKESLKKFTEGLTTSTDVINAYNQGLQNEYDTFANIVAQGWTETEDKEGTKRLVGAKQFAEYLKTYGDQLVNSWGEELMTEDGMIVTVKNGKFYDEKNNEVQVDNLRLNTSIFKFLEKILPEIKKDIAEGGLRGLNDEALAKLLAGQQSTILSGYALNSKASSFLLSNPEYMASAYDKQMTAVKEGTAFKDMSNSDILLEAEKGNYEAQKLIKEVFETIKKSAEDLVNSRAYAELKAGELTKKSTDAVNARIDELSNPNSWKYSGGSLETKDYGGMRGFRNGVFANLGFDRGYDREQYLSAMALRNPGAIGMSENRSAALQRVYNKTEQDAYMRLTDNGVDSTEASIQAKLEAEQAIVDLMTEEEKKAASIADSNRTAADELRTMGDSIGKSLMDASKSAFTAPFEALGESLIKGADAADDLAANMKNIAGTLLKQVGTAMATAGFNIAAGAALQQNWALVAGGLAMAAAGGFASGLGGALSSTDNNKDKDKAEDKTKKLEDLRDSLLDLLAQAREDAIYYENTLRHKKALSTNADISKTSVNDAIITPQGKVISTHPEDYLIATKTPQSLIGAGSTPTVNFSLVDKSTGVKISAQKATYNEKTNTVDFEAVIENKIMEVIAGTKGDDAFAAREARRRGQMVIA